jgi:hypothetical protein
VLPLAVPAVNVGVVGGEDVKDGCRLLRSGEPEGPTRTMTTGAFAEAADMIKHRSRFAAGLYEWTAARSVCGGQPSARALKILWGFKKDASRPVLD